MTTYQDLLAVGGDNRGEFILSAINDYRGSPLYRTALTAQKYAAKRNEAIEKYRKLLYDINGKAVPDNFSANHKCAAAFFPKFIAQEVQYLLGNGMTFEDESVKTKLDAKNDIDTIVQKAARWALIDGVAYGFRNLDHVELFRATEFVPLFDEDDGSMKAGIRWWQIAPDKPFRATLYELDGYTDYIKTEADGIRERAPKRPYVINYRYTPADGREIYGFSNYPSFPIVPLYGNEEKQSELIGLKETIDCYDLILSGFANDLDEASMLYWTLENCGGMDDFDLAKFKRQMATLKVANLEGGDNGAKAESHAIDVPYQSREVYLNLLSKRLYDNAMAFDPESIVSGAATATQIRAAYTNLNLKCNELEYCVNDFIAGLCIVAGIDKQIPTYKRDNIINVQEETQSIIMAANYLDDETIISKLPFLSPDEIEVVLERRKADESVRFKDAAGGAIVDGRAGNRDNE